MFISFYVIPFYFIRRFRGNIPFGAFTSCCNRLRELFRATKLQKVPRKRPRQDRKSDAGGETLKLVSVNFCKNAIFVLRNLSFCNISEKDNAPLCSKQPNEFSTNDRIQTGRFLCVQSHFNRFLPLLSSNTCIC